MLNTIVISICKPKFPSLRSFLSSQFDLDGDGQIERTEFIVRKLLLMGILQEDDVARVEEEFDKMDEDGSGEIMMDDLKLYLEKEDEGRRVRKEMESGKGGV